MNLFRFRRSFVLIALIAVVAIGQPVSAQNAIGDGTFVVRMVGYATPLEDNTVVPFHESIPADALCYEVPLYNANGSLRIGTGYDCLSNAVFGDQITTLTDHAVFRMPGGSILSAGDVTIAAAAPGTVSEPTTHTTGSRGEDNVLGARGRFEGATGGVRLSGLVDMSQFFETLEIGFDCIFVVDLSLDS